MSYQEERATNNASNSTQKWLRVYEKESKFKDGKKWYSATRDDGESVVIVFKCPVETESKAFEISKMIGTQRSKQVEKGNEIYNNHTYYITSCEFREIVGEELPF